MLGVYTSAWDSRETGCSEKLKDLESLCVIGGDLTEGEPLALEQHPVSAAGSDLALEGGRVSTWPQGDRTQHPVSGNRGPLMSSGQTCVCGAGCHLPDSLGKGVVCAPADWDALGCTASVLEAWAGIQTHCWILI